MSKLTLEKDDKRMCGTLAHATPTIAPCDTFGNFQVRFETGSETAIVTLTSTSLQTLGLQCTALQHMNRDFPLDQNQGG